MTTKWAERGAKERYLREREREREAISPHLCSSRSHFREVTHTHAHAWCTHTHTHAPTLTHPPTHPHTHTHTHTHTQTDSQTDMHTQTQTHTHTHTHTQTDTRTHTLTGATNSYVFQQDIYILMLYRCYHKGSCRSPNPGGRSSDGSPFLGGHRVSESEFRFL